MIFYPGALEKRSSTLAIYMAAESKTLAKIKQSSANIRFKILKPKEEVIKQIWFLVLRAALLRFLIRGFMQRIKIQGDGGLLI